MSTSIIYKIITYLLFSLLIVPVYPVDKKEKLEIIENCINEKRDESQWFNSVCDQIDSLKKAENISEKNIYQLVANIGESYRKQGKLTDALNLYLHIVSYYEQIKKPSNEEYWTLARFYVPLGASHEELGMWNRAMDFYMKGLDLSEKHKFKDLQAMIFNNIAVIHFNKTELDNAEIYLNKALAINKELDNKFELFYNYNNLSEGYMIRENYNKALDYALIGIQQVGHEDNPYLYYYMQANIGTIYLLNKDYKMALTYAKNAVVHQEQLGFHSDLIFSYSLMHKIYNELNQEDSAFLYINKALHLTRELNNKYQESKMLEEKSKFLTKQKKYKEAYEAILASNQINDSINRIDNMQRMDWLESMLDSKNYYENASSRDKFWAKFTSPKAATAFLVVIIFCIIAFVACYFWWKNREKQLRKTERELEPQLISLKTERDQLFQKKNELQLQLDEQNRLLTSSTLTNINDHEFIEDVKEELKKVLLELNPKDRNHRERIRNILNMTNNHNTQHSWDEFSYYFEKVHPSFYENLDKYSPNLTVKDKRLCALLLLGLSSKEISNITYKEVRSVESARNRLRKKLGIDKDTNIIEFLNNLK